MPPSSSRLGIYARESQRILGDRGAAIYLYRNIRNKNTNVSLNSVQTLSGTSPLPFVALAFFFSFALLLIQMSPEAC